MREKNNTYDKQFMRQFFVNGRNVLKKVPTGCIHVLILSHQYSPNSLFKKKELNNSL